MVHVDIERCTGCGICIDVCPQQAITINNDLASVNEDLCIQCGTCVDVCPAGAIREVTLVHTQLGKGGEKMVYGFGRGSGRRGGAGFGFRGGMGFGFRGSSPPWPYVGLGRGGLPRCGYFLSGAASTPAAWPYQQFPYPADPGFTAGQTAYPFPAATPPAPGTMPFTPQVTPEQELDFLKNQAEVMKGQLEQIETRVRDLESEK